MDIDFASSRREEVIQYVYERYGAEHTGMVCNVVTYRARSAVREVGYALGFPRPLVDRVAKALETYDSVMVRRDLEAEAASPSSSRRPAMRSRERERCRPEAAGGGWRRQTAAGERGLVDGWASSPTLVACRERRLAPVVGRRGRWAQRGSGVGTPTRRVGEPSEARRHRRAGGGPNRSATSPAVRAARQDRRAG